jgi:hypothetical protein
MKIVFLLVITLALVACDDGVGVKLDAGTVAVDAETPAADSQTVVAVPCITSAACADGFHRTALSEHYDALSIYACAVDAGVVGSEVANPCGTGEAYGYRSADLVTCRCH